MNTFNNVSPFQNKNILVFGLGILGGGVGVVNTLLKLGASIRITDQKTKEELSSSLDNIDIHSIDKLTLGKHDEDDIRWADIIIKNPAVATTSPFIQKALKLEKHVTTEAALYLKYSNAFTIGITGTRGKTTTTMMLFEILKKSLSQKVLVGGNIQNTGCLPLLLKEDAETVSIIELSSWALEGCHTEKVSPNIAILTNLYPDHLNRYKSIEAYAYDKLAIFAYQSDEDHAFLNTEHEWLPYFLERIPSSLHLYDQLTLPESVKLKIKGKHNRSNAAAALSVAKLMGVERDQIIESLETFDGVQYRQQKVGEKNGIQFINDSTSTTPTALEAALDTFPQATFIIGGTTKDLPLDSLVKKLATHSGQCVYLKGSGTQQLIKALQASTPPNTQPELFTSLSQAFNEALRITKQGEIVFSPGFTSFELFKNEFDRAQQFDDLVHQL